MAAQQTSKVHFHFSFGGKKASPDYVEYVQTVGAPTFDTVKTALSNGGKLLGSGTLEISSVQIVGLPLSQINA